jgi:hypothetical protein
MKNSVWNTIVGVMVVIVGGLSLVDHASDIYQPYQEEEMASEAKNILNNYVLKVDKIIQNAYMVEADSLLKIGEFTQIKSNRAYVLPDVEVEKIKKALERTERTLKNIKTQPTEAHLEFQEIPHTLIALLVITAGILLMSNNEYRYYLFFGALGASIIYDAVLLAIGGFNIWGLGIFFNLILCLTIFLANKGSLKPGGNIRA